MARHIVTLNDDEEEVLKQLKKDKSLIRFQEFVRTELQKLYKERNPGYNKSKRQPPPPDPIEVLRNDPNLSDEDFARKVLSIKEIYKKPGTDDFWIRTNDNYWYPLAGFKKKWKGYGTTWHDMEDDSPSDTLTNQNLPL